MECDLRHTEPVDGLVEEDSEQVGDGERDMEQAHREEDGAPEGDTAEHHAEHCRVVRERERHQRGDQICGNGQSRSSWDLSPCPSPLGRDVQLVVDIHDRRHSVCYGDTADCGLYGLAE